ncbi:hypothetical protein Q0F98_37175 [Paenibacillus amylolyticus]|nr:hypothetical protein Q0F98_37175 [Paenibacillus amylolyticus]
MNATMTCSNSSIDVGAFKFKLSNQSWRINMTSPSVKFGAMAIPVDLALPNHWIEGGRVLFVYFFYPVRHVG